MPPAIQSSNCPLYKIFVRMELLAKDAYAEEIKVCKECEKKNLCRVFFDPYQGPQSACFLCYSCFVARKRKSTKDTFEPLLFGTSEENFKTDREEDALEKDKKWYNQTSALMPSLEYQRVK
jgi:hypothetical protein